MKIRDFYYFDCNATLPVRKEALKAYLEGEKLAFANPSSSYPPGKVAKEYLENSRKTILKNLNFDGDLIFTSSATESNHLALLSYAQNKEIKRIIMSKVEHPSIYELQDVLKGYGKEVCEVSVDKNCLVDLNQIESLLKEKRSAVALIFAHNEAGVIQNFEEIAKICQRYNALLHLDCVQAFSKIELPFKKYCPDTLSIASHKIGGPKGIAGLTFKKGVKLHPMLLGGGQEKGLRSSTESVPLIHSFATAADSINLKKYRKIERLRDYFERKLSSLFDIEIYGKNSLRLPNTSFFSLRNFDGREIQEKLSKMNICVGTGSACHASSSSLPKVIFEMGYKDVQFPLRVSFSYKTKRFDVLYLLQKLEEITKMV